MRVNYWSSSKFAKFITSTFAKDIEMKNAMTAEDWKKWHTNFKTKHKFVHWFTEKFLNKLQNFLCKPYDTFMRAKWYLDNRFIAKSHYIRTGLQIGQHHDVVEKLLHGPFTMLVEFVEIEKASSQIAFNPGKYNTNNAVSRADAGLDHLIWESQLVNEYEWLPEEERKLKEDYGMPTRQAEDAKVIIRLYYWWKFTRPARPDPYACDKEYDDILDLLSDNSDETREQMETARLLEEKYKQEDQDMLMELVKIRFSLWT